MEYFYNGKRYDTSTLPKWAQEFTRALKLENAQLKAEIERKIAQVGVTKTVLDCSPFTGKEVPQYIPDDTRVRFIFGPREWADFIEVRRTGSKTLQVYSGKQLIIRPNVTNIVYVEVGD